MLWASFLETAILSSLGGVIGCIRSFLPYFERERWLVGTGHYPNHRWSVLARFPQTNMAILSGPHSHLIWAFATFFCGGYLKERVFRSQLHNLEELKMWIREEITALPALRCAKEQPKLQISPSTLHCKRRAPFSWYHLQKVITKTALYADSNKTKNYSVCIVLFS